MLKRLTVELSALAASVRNATKDSHTALLIFLLKGSVPNLDTHRSLRDAAADDADMRRYASACSCFVGSVTVRFLYMSIGVQ
jgi:hypothetical protein